MFSDPVSREDGQMGEETIVCYRKTQWVTCDLRLSCETNGVEYLAKRMELNLASSIAAT
jgi:hypothetical protein